MRKTFLFISSVVFLAACSNSGTSGTSKSADDSNNSSVTKENTEAPKDPEIQKGLQLVAKSGCFGCHKVAEKLTGPAYVDVAARYPKNDAVIDSLSDKVMKGGSGNWGPIPMTPNPVTKDDAKAMVTYILSLKK